MKFLGFFSFLLFSNLLLAQSVPDGFVDLSKTIPTIEIELRYASQNNFIGTKVDGYETNRCFLSKNAAQALLAVQNELFVYGLGIKIYDAYRPQRAVDHFVRWAGEFSDTKMKALYYPDVEKSQLFEKGYIAAHSGHSRGSTIDLTIIDLATKKELDMGTGFDYFSPLSWPSNKEMTAQQRGNRLLLHSVMLRHGFRALPEEWWHFTLENEPYPNTYFDFPIR
jgi:zinc D-Ala-D-Ala dipeptidase